MICCTSSVFISLLLSFWFCKDMNTYRTKLMTSSTYSHKVQVCQDKTVQAELLTQYISDGLLNNEAVIITARPALRKSVWSKLQALGLDMTSYKAQGQIKLYDAELLLSTVLIDDAIDEHYFHTFFGSQIEAAQAAYGKVRAFGEMLDILWQRELHDTALQLENLRNELCKKHELTVLCTYLPNDPDHFVLQRACNCRASSLPMYALSAEESGGTLFELFGTAWSKIVNQLTQSKPASDHLR